MILLALNSRFIHASLAPFCLKEYAVSRIGRSADIRIIDANINNANEEIIDRVLQNICGKNQGPERIGLSVYVFNRNKALEILRALKELIPGAYIFAGGPEASADPVAFLDGGADCVVRGEGEEAFLRILTARDPPRGIIEGIPAAFDYSPYSEEYFQNADGKIAYFEASRGCPFNCSYCMSAGCRVRRLGLSKVKEELKKFKGRGIRILKFTDRTFNANLAYSKAIMEYAAGEFKDENIKFHFEAAPDLWDEEWIETALSARPGLFQFELGFQSFDPKVLKAVRRRQDPARSLELVRRLRESGRCKIHADLIAGLPFDSAAGIAESFDVLFSSGPDEIQLGVLKLLKGSEIRRQAETLWPDYVFNPSAPYEVYSTPWIDGNTMPLIKKTAKVVDKLYNSRRFENTLSRILTGGEAVFKNSPYSLFFEFAVFLERYSVNIHLLSLDALFKYFMEFLSGFYAAETVKTLLRRDYSDSVKNRIPKFLTE